MKKALRTFLALLVGANTATFLLLAGLHWLPTDPKSAVFIDFWGRFTVYSLWFIGFALYRFLLVDRPLARRFVVALVAMNIPLFLGLAYFDRISNAPDNLVFVDFWGRITVYSLWFMCYELYRVRLAE
jgi:hypothetical protein